MTEKEDVRKFDKWVGEWDRNNGKGLLSHPRLVNAFLAGLKAGREDVRKMKGRGKEKVKERANKRKMHCINCGWHGSGKPNQKCPKCRDLLAKGDVT